MLYFLPLATAALAAIFLPLPGALLVAVAAVVALIAWQCVTFIKLERANRRQSEVFQTTFAVNHEEDQPDGHRTRRSGSA